MEHWGQSLSLDLSECDVEKLKDSEGLKKFVIELCEKLEMKPHGETLIERFGQGELEGWSFMQFIETSSITGHLDEFGARAFIDIFSCKNFDPKTAVQFCKKYFKAKKTNLNNLFRD